MWTAGCATNVTCIVHTVIILYSNVLCVVANKTMLLSKQDLKLREAVALYSGQGIRRGADWKKVSSHMEGTRSPKHCKRRFHNILKLTDSGLIKEGAWTEDGVIHASIILVLSLSCNKSIALCSCLYFLCLPLLDGK